MNTARKAAGTIVAALLTLGFSAGTAHANQTASATSCRIEFVSLTASDLWHGKNDQDWMWFVIGGKYYPGNTRSIPFYQGTTQTAGTFSNPVKYFPYGSTTTLQVVVDRTWPSANVVIDSNTITCSPTGSNLPLRFSDGNATYDLKYNATLT